MKVHGRRERLVRREEAEERAQPGADLALARVVARDVVRGRELVVAHAVAGERRRVGVDAQVDDRARVPNVGGVLHEIEPATAQQHAGRNALAPEATGEHDADVAIVDDLAAFARRCCAW